MIIGISGKIGSGKDTVGMIIQGLTVNPNADFDWIKKFHPNSIWKVHKFAGKLKDITCLLIGCTREQLEDQNFKNSELPKEWDYKELFREKRIITLDPDNEYPHIPFKKMTPRIMLQLLGTNAGRDIIHPNIWVNSLFADYRPLDDTRRASMGNVLDYSDCIFPNWIITDMRFPNEKKAV